MEEAYYTRIDNLCKQIEQSEKEGKDVDWSLIVDLYNYLSSYHKSLLDEVIKISILRQRMYQLLPSEFRPKYIPTILSEQQLNEIYGRLIGLDYIEGSRDDFLAIFNPTSTVPHPLIKWIKRGRNKTNDWVTLINFILLMLSDGNPDKLSDDDIVTYNSKLKEYSETFFGVSVSKSTISRAGVRIELRKLGMLLGF